MAALLTGRVQQLPDTFLPFIPALAVIPPMIFRALLQVTFLGAAAALLFNRSVRIATTVLGVTLLLAVLSSRAYYENNRTFFALILLLAGLTKRGEEPWFVRMQVAIVFLGAGLDKLLDAGWRTGAFMATWASVPGDPNLLATLANAAPSLPVAQIASWTTILGELNLGAILLVPAAYPLAIWGLLVFEVALLVQGGTTFGMFFYTTCAATLAFMRWPKQDVLVGYDGDCGFCQRTKRSFERLDLDGLFVWKTYQSGAGGPHGISDAMAQKSMYMVDGTRIYSGFRAFRRAVMLNPASYILLSALLAWRGEGRMMATLSITVLVVFSPLFAPIGERVYQLIARNRHRIMDSESCAIP